MRVSLLCLPVLWLAALLVAAKKPAPGVDPAGEARNARAEVHAALLTSDEANQAFGHDFEGHFTVVEVRVTPIAGPVDVRLDDFVLRTDKDGERTTPFAANQIAGTGALVVKQPAQNNISNGSPSHGLKLPGALGRSRQKKTDDKEAAKAAEEEAANAKPADEKGDADLKSRLIAKMLPEGTAKAGITGLLFFSLEKQRPKDLELIYALDPADKIRLRFK